MMIVVSIGQCDVLWPSVWGWYTQITCIVIDLLIQIPHKIGTVYSVRYAVSGGELSITCDTISISCVFAMS
jgi:hypothetical protein